MLIACLFLSLLVLTPVSSKVCTDQKPIYLVHQTIPSGELPAGVSVVYDDAAKVHGYKLSTEAVGKLQLAAAKIFDKCDFFPSEFSLLITLKVRLINREQYIVSLLAPDGTIDFGLKITELGQLVLQLRESNGDRPNEALYSDIGVYVPGLFNNEWHTLVIQVGWTDIAVKLDCSPLTSKTWTRDYKMAIDVSKSIFYVGSNNNRTDALFSGYLKQILLLPESDVGVYACPVVFPNDPSKTPADGSNDVDNSKNVIAALPNRDRPGSICTWKDTGKLFFDAETRTLLSCISGVWKAVSKYSEAALDFSSDAPSMSDGISRKKAPPKLEYFLEYQNLKHPDYPATDIEVFKIPMEGLFMAMALSPKLDVFQAKNSSSQDSIIWRWRNGYFEKYQLLQTNGARQITAFEMGQNTYLAVANSGITMAGFAKTQVFRWNKKRKKFKLIQELESEGARDAEYFTIENKHFLAVANAGFSGKKMVTSYIFEWSSQQKQFVKVQSLPTKSAYDFTFFTLNIDGITYYALAVASAYEAPSSRSTSAIYIWQYGQFMKHHEILTTDNNLTNGATDWEFFRHGGMEFLAVANSYNIPMLSKSDKINNSTIYVLDRSTYRFEPYQTIVTDSNLDWEHFIVGDDLYLIAANAQFTPVERSDDSDGSKQLAKSPIYKWQGVEKFVKVHELSTFPASDWEDFEAPEGRFLVYGNFQGTTSQIFKMKLS